MNHSDDITQQKFREILFIAYELGNETEDVNLHYLLEVLKQHLITMMLNVEVE